MNHSESDSLPCACCGDCLRGDVRPPALHAAASAPPALPRRCARHSRWPLRRQVTRRWCCRCIDPRFQKPVHRYTDPDARPDRQVQPVHHRRRRDRRGRARRSRTGSQAFWDNLAASIQLHSHHKGDRDRSSRLRRGEDRLRRGQASPIPKIETETHRDAMAEFRKQVGGEAAEAQGRDRPDGDRRQDRDVRSARRAAPQQQPAAHQIDRPRW